MQYSQSAPARSCRRRSNSSTPKATNSALAKGDRNPALPRSRQATLGVASCPAAWDLGLQFFRQHTYLQEAHFPSTTENRKGPRNHPSWLPQVVAISSSPDIRRMYLNDTKYSIYVALKPS